MRRRGASRLSRCPCCPSRLGFCFPQQKSHTPGQTRCQDDTSTQEAPGSYSPDRGKGYSRDPGNRRWWQRQEAENQRATLLPLLREPWALHSTLWKWHCIKAPSTCLTGEAWHHGRSMCYTIAQHCQRWKPLYPQQKNDHGLKTTY